MVDNYEVFAEFLGEKQLAETILPILFENGFDEWELVKDMNSDLLSQIGITDENQQQQILECIQLSHQLQSNDQQQDEQQNTDQEQQGQQQQQTEQEEEEQKNQENNENEEKLRIENIKRINNQLKNVEQKVISVSDLLKSTSKKREGRVTDNSFLSEITILSLNDKKITQIQNINLCQNLKTLHLFQNYLQNIEGLENLYQLTTLHLENNFIMKIEGLESLINLEKLFLSKNCITRVEGLETLINLREFNISNQDIGKCSLNFEESSLQAIGENLVLFECENNNVTNIEKFSHFQSLNKLVLKNNKISSFESFLEPLSYMKILSDLDLRGNPLCKVQKYRDRFVLMSKSLEQLDEKKILPKERQFLLALWKKKHGMMEKEEKKQEISSHIEKIKDLAKVNGTSIRNLQEGDQNYKNPKNYQKLNSGLEFHTNTCHSSTKHVPKQTAKQNFNMNTNN